MDTLSAILEMASEGYVFDDLLSREIASQRIELVEAEVKKIDWFGKPKPEEPQTAQSSLPVRIMRAMKAGFQALR